MLGGHIMLDRLEKPVRMGTARAEFIPDVCDLAQVIDHVKTMNIPFGGCPLAFLRSDDDEMSHDNIHDLMRIVPIVQEMAASHILMRDAESWNHLVNTPMLKMAIPWTPFALHEPFPDDPFEPIDDMPRGSARVEPVMNATLAPNSNPVLLPQPPGPQRQLRHLTPAPRPFGQGEIPPRALNPQSFAQIDVSRPGIDYSFVLDLSESDDLQQTMKRIAMKDPNVSTNISQTYLPAVMGEFLAVGIKTHCPWPVDGDDSSLAHLCTWAVAFHRRVAQLRAINLGLDMGTDGEDQDPFLAPDDEPMPTLPLIRITGMIWEIFFAVDHGDYIELTEPEELGCTGTIPEAYRLFLALQEIGEWVETVFYDRMTELFTLEE